MNEFASIGAANFQLSRRLRAMLDNLLESLPENRRPALPGKDQAWRLTGQFRVLFDHLTGNRNGTAALGSNTCRER